MPNPPRRLYGETGGYERKLARVMERLGAADLHFDYGRFEAWIEFKYKGELYRFEHSVRKAQERGLNIRFGSDCFVQLVLSLEDLARMVERGIYDLGQWIEGMKALPAGATVPGCFLALGLDRIPSSVDEVEASFKTAAKRAHPDGGGSSEAFRALQIAREQAVAHFTKDGGSA